ncbi:MAG: hypothetical protein H0V13_08920 [Nocardioidaceae bacterium]|nr:hypothetical protein [Nocardioidaceae bacterium]
MSNRQRIERNLLSVLALGSGVLCVVAAVVLVTGAGNGIHGVLLGTVWVSGIVGLATSVAACRVEDDSTEDPAYFASIVRGLRKEWQRS